MRKVTFFNVVLSENFEDSYDLETATDHARITLTTAEVEHINATQAAAVEFQRVQPGVGGVTVRLEAPRLEFGTLIGTASYDMSMYLEPRDQGSEWEFVKHRIAHERLVINGSGLEWQAANEDTDVMITSFATWELFYQSVLNHGLVDVRTNADTVALAVNVRKQKHPDALKVLADNLQELDNPEWLPNHLRRYSIVADWQQLEFDQLLKGRFFKDLARPRKKRTSNKNQ